jgi:hypothetical protein
MWREKLQDEARAKIFWGDSPATVSAYLMSQGFNQEEATTTIEAILVERAESVKSSGKKAIFIGVPLILVPFVSFFIFSTFGVFPIKLFGLTVAIGLLGGWKLVKGTMMVASPRSQEGDLSNPDDMP